MSVQEASWDVQQDGTTVSRCTGSCVDGRHLETSASMLIQAGENLRVGALCKSRLSVQVTKC
jgi:hypothetical protein